MKSFMKFIVTLIVLGVIAFVVGFLVMNSNNKPNVVVDSNENEVTINSGEILEEETNKSLTKEEIVSEIDKQVTAINYNGVTNEFDKRITESEATDSMKEFMEYFKVKDMLVKVRIRKGCIEMIPYSDFIENMVYYFDGAGNLILFESVSTTVGGSYKYYFRNGELVDSIAAYYEKVDKTPENTEEILKRAKNLFDNYGNMFKNSTNNKEFPIKSFTSGENIISERSGE